MNTMLRLNGARTTRRYLQVSLSKTVMHQVRNPWVQFIVVEHMARREGLDPARLEWRRCTETPIGITAVFEVV